MKKLISLFAAITMLSTVAAQAATLENYVPKDDNTYTVEHEGLNAGAYYGMVAVLGDGLTELDLQNTENIMYIDQATADATGKISFSGFAPKGVAPSDDTYQVSTVFIGGGDLATATAIGVLRETGFEEEPDVVTFVISGKALDEVSAIKLAKITVTDAEGNVLNADADGNVTEADAEGVYAVPVPAGTGYSVEITKDGYLTFTYTNVNVEEDVTLKDVTITNLAGDVNENGEIKLDDLLDVLADYDHTDIDESEDNDIVKLLADVNGNKEVKLDDLLALMAGYDGKNVTAEAAYVEAE